MISVIVCTYNRAPYIGKCLRHLADQTASKTSYEVIVIDNNSTDQSSELIKEAIQRHQNTTIRYYLETTVGLSHARNRGIKESSGRVLAFVDDDAFAAPKYVAEVDRYFADHPEVVAVGGKIVPVYEEEAPAWMTHYLLPLVAAVDMGSSSKPYPRNKFPIGANMAFRSSVFEEIGNFNPALGRIANELGAGEEKDLFLQLRAGGGLIHYAPEILVRHIIPAKRLEESYIRRMGQGVGRSERQRLTTKPTGQVFRKIVSEMVKTIGTIVLFIAYALQGRLQAATMLVKFRFWVLQGLIQ
ncbi:MAG: glycosyltransferase [Bacteroidota bacterium]